MPLYQPDVRTGHFVKQTKVELKGAKLNFEELLLVTTRYKYSTEWETGGDRRPVTQLARPSCRGDHTSSSSTKYVWHTENTGNLETSGKTEEDSRTYDTVSRTLWVMIEVMSAALSRQPRSQIRTSVKN